MRYVRISYNFHRFGPCLSCICTTCEAEGSLISDSLFFYGTQKTHNNSAFLLYLLSVYFHDLLNMECYYFLSTPAHYNYTQLLVPSDEATTLLTVGEILIFR